MSIVCQHGELGRVCRMCELESEIERLNAQVAMLQPDIDKLITLWWKPVECAICGSHLAAEYDTKDWLTRHDAEVRKAALLEAAKWFEDQAHRETSWSASRAAAELTEMANEEAK